MAHRLTRPADTRARIALLRHNPYFVEGVLWIRKELGLPSNGLPPAEAADWAIERQYDEAVLEPLRGLLRDYGLPDTLDLELLQYVADNNPAHLSALGPGTGRLRAVHREFGDGTAELRVAFSISGDSKAEIMKAVEERYDWLVHHHSPPRVRSSAQLDERLEWWRERREQGKTGAQIATELQAKGRKITTRAVNKAIREVESLMLPLSGRARAT